MMKKDLRLRLFCLSIKADIDGEMQSEAMQRDWEQIAWLARLLKDTKWQYRAAAGLGMAAFYRGDIETARKKIVGALLSAMAAHDVGSEVKYLYAIGNGLTATKQYGDAIEYLDEAIKVSLATPGAPYPFMMYVVKGQALAGLGKFGQARKIVNDVLRASKQNNVPIYQESTLLTSAAIDRQQHDLSAAETDLKQAINICRNSGFLRNLVEAQLALSDVYRSRGELPKAEEILSQASAGSQSNGEFYSLPERLDLLAQIQMAQGRFAEADRTYDRADAFVDAVVAADPTVIDKTAWINFASDMYTRHFALLVDKLNDSRKAFGIIEQVRGRTMTDLLLGGSRTEAATPGVENTISELRLKLMNAQAVSEVQSIRDQLLTAERARWLSPTVDIVKTRAGSHVSLSLIQQTLSPSAAILEYVIAEPHSYCVVILRDGFHVVALEGKAKIEARVTTYLKAIGGRKPSDRAASDVYESLLRPIGDVARKKALLIVRDGVLHLLPFDALHELSGPYVGESSIVSYLPSAASFYLLAHQRTGSDRRRRDLFAVGGVPYSTEADQIKKLIDLRGIAGQQISNLPNSAEEILAAGTGYKDSDKTILTGSASTEAAVKQAPLADYRILHFAVHGISDREHPDGAGLLLLQDREKREDGLLSASEIAQIHLRADLVVLSACDTAIGPVEGEEGISTLSKAFLLAGARGVVSTLWSADDNSSLELIRQFYVHYRAGNSAAESLTLAKQDMLKKFGHNTAPYYWAAFSFEGVPLSAVYHHGSKS
jgi:CHAT domain-containing protein